MVEKKKNILGRIFTNIYVRNIILIILTFLAILFLILLGLSYYTKHDETVIVPSLKGLQISEVDKIMNGSHMQYVVVDSTYTDGATPGAVVEQIPADSSKVKKGRTIYLIVQASGTQTVEIPKLSDFSRRQAEAQLNSLGFIRININEVASIYKGLVISVLYKGKEVAPNQKIPKGASLTLIVGAGGEENPDETNQDSIPATDDNSFFD